jgi:hypothetical protein
MGWFAGFIVGWREGIDDGCILGKITGLNDG